MTQFCPECGVALECAQDPWRQCKKCGWEGNDQSVLSQPLSINELDALRTEISQEAPYVGVKPFSHNIIRLVLAEIDRKYGREEANKAVRDFKPKGFKEEPE